MELIQGCHLQELFGFPLFPVYERRNKKILFTAWLDAINCAMSTTDRNDSKETIISHYCSKQPHLQIKAEPGRNILMDERGNERSALNLAVFAGVSKQPEDHKR